MGRKLQFLKAIALEKWQKKAKKAPFLLSKNGHFFRFSRFLSKIAVFGQIMAENGQKSPKFRQNWAKMPRKW